MWFKEAQIKDYGDRKRQLQINLFIEHMEEVASELNLKGQVDIRHNEDRWMVRVKTQKR